MANESTSGSGGGRRSGKPSERETPRVIEPKNPSQKDEETKVTSKGGPEPDTNSVPAEPKTSDSSATSQPEPLVLPDTGIEEFDDEDQDRTFPREVENPTHAKAIELPGQFDRYRVDLSIEEVERDNGRKEEWWCGTFRTCPRANIAIGGIEFVDYCDLPIGTSDPATGGQQRSVQFGSIIRLTPDQAQKVLHAMSRKVVQVFGENSSPMDFGESAGKGRKPRYVRPGGHILSRDHAHYAPSANHKPLAKFVYFAPASYIASARSRTSRNLLPPSAYDMWSPKGKRATAKV